MLADDTAAAADAVGGDAVVEAAAKDAGDGRAPATSAAAAPDASAQAADSEEKDKEAPQEWDVMDVPFEWRPRPLLKVRARSPKALSASPLVRRSAWPRTRRCSHLAWRQQACMVSGGAAPLRSLVQAQRAGWAW